MPQKIYIVDLTEDERNELHDLIKKGKPSARKVARAVLIKVLFQTWASLAAYRPIPAYSVSR
jgi:hypothetical protein